MQKYTLCQKKLIKKIGRKEEERQTKYNKVFFGKKSVDAENRTPDRHVTILPVRYKTAR